LVAPPTVKVAELPGQTVAPDDILNTGLLAELTCTVLVPKQTPLSPVTVYMVVLLGFTLIVCVVKFPGIHVKVAAPTAPRKANSPGQID
jgi:hypothetical protein